MKMKKTPWWQAVLLAAFAVALAFGAYSVSQVGNHLQYLIAPPHKLQTSGGEETPVKPNEPVAQWYAALKDVAEEWDSTMEAWTLGGVMENASLSAEGGGTQGRVTVMGENGTTLHPLQLRFGRNFFPEELRDGAHVIILDEQAALALFRISDPIDRKVTVQGVEYRVIGVARHRKQVGDLTDYGAYIPLMSVIDQDITLDALQVEAAPRIGVGASVSFSTVCGTWQQGGTVIDLGKEGMAATLWLRVLLCFAGATALLRLIGWLNGQVRSYAKQYRQQLQVRYALSLMPQLAGMILLFCLGYGGAAALAAVLMNVIIQPVYTFPEWIPAVLVEWEDIAAAFWKVWQTSATLREMRSPEILRLRYFTLLIQGCSAATGVLLALWYARRRTALQGVAESLPEMRRQGVVVSVIRTARPIAFGELGYVPCAESEVWQREPDGAVRRRRGRKTTPMLRIIHVQRLLEQLPASPKDGSFVLEVTDAQIPANNARWEITCEKGVKTVERAERDWDIQLPVQTLARVVYGSGTFHDFLENNADFDLRMRSPAMDGLFDQHMPLTEQAL